MGITQIITIIIALVIIAFILWWFFAPHKQQAEAATIVEDEQTANIVVNGGYSPATVVLKKGIPAQINFDLKDSTACLSHVVFEQLGVNKDLTKQPITTVTIPTDKAGTYNFACGMDMFHGKVIVK
ncbi:cupredoxin domain-containing protein [Lactobacillus sp. PV037]|uniref:cupredoxin domain-containing protein n=1 Tax=unclassified Lactobacillus TaxID=2620435 RepID=UPI002240298F|nr:MULTISPECIES: cupredoxin domain-containing protein [unclassified Lactobacillus]QNQ81581.1 cupredoxin domain-containing protein [Lactobacillus sp. PV012]QNQ84373.1 cupredoxin domain-containing protein [Lactobacillus sp. PV037]